MTTGEKEILKKLTLLFEESLKKAGFDQAMIVWGARKGEDLFTSYTLPKSGDIKDMQELFWMMCTRLFGDFSFYLNPEE